MGEQTNTAFYLSEGKSKSRSLAKSNPYTTSRNQSVLVSCECFFQGSSVAFPASQSVCGQTLRPSHIHDFLHDFPWNLLLHTLVSRDTTSSCIYHKQKDPHYNHTNIYLIPTSTGQAVVAFASPAIPTSIMSAPPASSSSTLHPPSSPPSSSPSSLYSSSSAKDKVLENTSTWLKRMRQRYFDGVKCDVTVRVTVMKSSFLIASTESAPRIIDIPCHSLVLGTRSDYFDRALLGGWAETEAETVNITREDDQPPHPSRTRNH